MSTNNVILPMKPRIVKEDAHSGIYEIDGLYPGYGHTLGNSLRRIILSSLPGAAITSIKIEGVSHEFSVVDGMKEDIITFILNLKRIRFKIHGDEKQKISFVLSGPKVITAGDIKTPSQVEVLNADEYLCELTGKVKIDMEIEIEKGLGYVAKEVLQKEKVSIGTIAVDAIFTPVRRVSYEVENMRVGDRTDHNRLRIKIETDGTVSPKEALEKSIEIMIMQLKAIVGFKEEEVFMMNDVSVVEEDKKELETKKVIGGDDLKTKLEDLDISSRTMNALREANIKTVGGLSRKKKDDLLEIDGIGEKGIQEIKRALGNFGLTLK